MIQVKFRNNSRLANLKGQSFLDYEVPHISSPWIVTGIGRSGTSTVAKILSTRFNIIMGLQFSGPTKNNPEGLWEDLHFKEANKAFIFGDITYKYWLRLISEITEDRAKPGIEWGFKDPNAAFILGLYIGMFYKPNIIWCHRDKDLICKSFKKCYGWDKEQTEEYYRIKYNTVKRILRSYDNYLKIDFKTDRLTDEDIIQRINEKWPDIQLQPIIQQK